MLSIADRSLRHSTALEIVFCELCTAIVSIPEGLLGVGSEK